MQSAAKEKITMYTQHNKVLKNRSIRTSAVIIIVLFILLASSANIFYMKYRNIIDASAIASTVKETSKKKGCCDVPATKRRMIGTYYTTKKGFISTLILNNKGPNAIEVTTILHNSEGEEYTLPIVSVNGQSSLKVDLNQAVEAAGHRFKAGSVEFVYEGRLLEVGGGITIINKTKSLIFDEQMLEEGMKFPSPRLESVFSIPSDSAEVTAILTNTKPKLLKVDGEVTYAGLSIRLPFPVILGPHHCQAVKLPSGLIRRSKGGAISLNHDGEKGALLAMIHVESRRSGFSATVNFSDPGRSKTSSLHGAGFYLGKVKNESLKPVVVARNLSDSVSTITARVTYTNTEGVSGVIELPQLTLDPGEIEFLDTTNLKSRQLRAVTAGVEIEYTGLPGSIIASAHSESLNGNQVFVLPLKDPQGGLSSTGGYPWFIDETSSTVVFIKNTTDEIQRFIIEIIYPGGKWAENIRTIAPGQNFKLDIKEIRDSQITGLEGTTIPSYATDGHVMWSVIGGRNKVLIGRAQTIDLANGITSTYECQCQCPLDAREGRLTPDTAVGFPSDSQHFKAEQKYADCHGNPAGWYDAGGPVSWSHNGLVSISPDGVATAYSPGEAYIIAEWEAEVWYNDPYEGGCRTEPRSINVTAYFSIVDFKLNGPVNCKDGDTKNLSVEILNGSPNSYEWSFTTPSGAGNNPNLNFGSPNSDSTSAKCHWFASPNQECAPSSGSSAPYYNSEYSVKCKVTFAGGKSKTKETKLTVNAYWEPAGAVDPNEARIVGVPARAADGSGVWRITGMGNLARKIPIKQVFIPTISQFFSKVDAHEQEHFNHWVTGHELFGNTHNPTVFYNRIKDFTGTSETDLLNKVTADFKIYTDAQDAYVESNHNRTEKLAYAVSDPLAPKYAYQNCGKY